MNQVVIYAVYGASGCGRSIMPIARASLMRGNLEPGRLVFIDDSFNLKEVNGHDVLTYSEFLLLDADKKYVAIGISDGIIREKLALKCRLDGLIPWTIIAENAVVMDRVAIGEGSILSPFVTIGSNVSIGKNFHANLYSYVEHDCIVGDFVTFAPSVKCNGNIVIEDHVYVGAGAVIKQGSPARPLTIGRYSIIGMGAVVTKDIPPGVVVVGCPARVIEGRT